MARLWRVNRCGHDLHGQNYAPFGDTVSIDPNLKNIWIFFCSATRFLGGIIAREIYSEILQSSSVELDGGLTAQADGDLHDGKTFKKPRRPYEKERLDAELKLVGGELFKALQRAQRGLAFLLISGVDEFSLRIE